MMRITDAGAQRKYWQWQPQGKRPVGRPRRRQREGVDAALKMRETSLSTVNEERLYDRRDDWRRLVLSKCLLTDC